MTIGIAIIMSTIYPACSIIIIMTNIIIIIMNVTMPNIIIINHDIMFISGTSEN